jgi:uncharacterized phage-like protein YoqJ
MIKQQQILFNQVAKEIRVLLKEKFPQIKFNVVSEFYFGENEIRICWVNGKKKKVASIFELLDRSGY